MSSRDCLLNAFFQLEINVPVHPLLTFLESTWNLMRMLVVPEPERLFSCTESVRSLGTIMTCEFSLKEKIHLFSAQSFHVVHREWQQTELDIFGMCSPNALTEASLLMLSKSNRGRFLRGQSRVACRRFEFPSLGWNHHLFHHDCCSVGGVILRGNEWPCWRLPWKVSQA